MSEDQEANDGRDLSPDAVEILLASLDRTSQILAASMEQEIRAHKRLPYEMAIFLGLLAGLIPMTPWWPLAVLMALLTFVFFLYWLLVLHSVAKEPQSPGRVELALDKYLFPGQFVVLAAEFGYVWLSSDILMACLAVITIVAMCYIPTAVLILIFRNL